MTADRTYLAESQGRNAMKATMLACVMLSSMPAMAIAQSANSAADAGGEHDAISMPDPDRLDAEIDDTVTTEPTDLEGVERQAVSDRPLVIEPKLDMTPEDPDETSGPIGSDQADPLPAPGIVIKIPTR